MRAASEPYEPARDDDEPLTALEEAFVDMMVSILAKKIRARERLRIAGQSAGAGEKAAGNGVTATTVTSRRRT